MESCRPLTISDALGEMKSGDATVFAGGTDLMVRKVWKNKCVFIGSIPELKTVRKTKSGMEIGAAATITELLENPIIPDFMKKVFEQMASPAIRNRATLGGNAGNASPAGDSLPMLYALRAGIVLADLDPAGQVFFMSVSKQVEFLVREEGSKEVERNTVADELRRTAVDIFDADQREILIPVARRTDLARHGVSGLEGVDLDLLLGDIDIVRRVQIIIVG